MRQKTNDNSNNTILLILKLSEKIEQKNKNNYNLY